MAGSEETPWILHHHTYRGTKYPNSVLDTSIEAMQTFNVRKDDVWVVTYPKAGTHWLLEIVGLIHARGDPAKVDRSVSQNLIEMIDRSQEFPTTRREEIENPMDMTPFMDFVDTAPSPRFIQTHMSLDLLPPKLLETSKVIYVARNAKDVLTSWYNFLGRSSLNTYSWESILQTFTSDEPFFGGWADHVLDFWKIRQKEMNVLFLFYEDAIKNPEENVRRVAAHVGVDLTEAEIEKVVKYSSFDAMKKTLENTSVGTTTGPYSFMYKGKIAEWKNVFTVAQSEALDRWIEEKIGGMDITFTYE